MAAGPGQRGFAIVLWRFPSSSLRRVTPRLAEALRCQEKLLDVTQLTPAVGRSKFKWVRTGKVALAAEPAAAGSSEWKPSCTKAYDDTNPEGRQAKMLADQAIQRASGRQDAISGSDQIMREPGSRYIGILNPWSDSEWASWATRCGDPDSSIVDARRKKLLKRALSASWRRLMPKHYYLLSYLLWRIILLPVDVGVPLLFGVWVFGVPVRGSFVALVALRV